MNDLIPPAALQQHIAVLGKTGAGKSYAARAAIVEPLLASGKRVSVIDPTGAWWGLRSSRDGKGPGFPVLVLGGDHGDLPLPSLGGAAVARLLVDQGVNLVADTSLLTVGERTRWFIDFAGTLYRANRAPLHLVLDEAHNFAPQGKVPDPDTGRMLHAANALASGGRSRGVRLTMITQRPQKLHKDALTSADTLIAMRVLAPQDRQAVRDWIEGCGDMQVGRDVLASLAGLPRGTGWVWYPEGKHLEKTHFPAIRTFDSSATPTDGRAVQAPKGAAEIDLSEIRAALADAVKEAEANDPKLLRKRIAELERRPAEKVLAIDHDAVREAEARGYEAGRAEAMATRNKATEILKKFMRSVTEMHAELDAIPAEAGPRNGLDRAPAPSMVKHSVQFAKTRNSDNSTLSKAERLVLTALAQYPQGRTKVQVAILTGYAVNGGGFNNAISALRSAGRLEGSGDRLTVTQAGLDALGPFARLPVGLQLLQHWLGRLGKAERAVLQVLADAYPKSLSKVDVAQRAGYEPGGGGFNNALSRLRTLELIAGSGELRASEDLFA